MNMVELKSVGHHIDTRTGYIYPSFADGGYQEDAGMHLEDIMDDVAWDEGLSDEDRAIVDKCPKIALDVTDGLDIAYAVEYLDRHVLPDSEDNVIMWQLGQWDVEPEYCPQILHEFRVMHDSLRQFSDEPIIVSEQQMLNIMMNEIADVRGEDTHKAYGIVMYIKFYDGAKNTTLIEWARDVGMVDTEILKAVQHYHRIQASMV